VRRIDPAGVAQLRRRGTLIPDLRSPTRSLSECFPLVTVCPQVLRTLRLLRGDAFSVFQPYRSINFLIILSEATNVYGRPEQLPFNSK